MTKTFIFLKLPAHRSLEVRRWDIIQFFIVAVCVWNTSECSTLIHTVNYTGGKHYTESGIDNNRSAPSAEDKTSLQDEKVKRRHQRFLGPCQHSGEDKQSRLYHLFLGFALHWILAQKTVELK